jgi:CheY-like chemotaxis protein
VLLGFGEHNTRVAYSGIDGLNLLANFVPELCIVDIGMPIMNGYEFARAFRAMPQFKNCYLAALTGWGDSAARERSKQAGFDEHLTKPLNFDALEAVIAKALDIAGN